MRQFNEEEISQIGAFESGVASRMTTDTGSRTRSRFRYQDECAALIMIDAMDQADIRGILTEYRDIDIVVLPVGSPPVAVSVKHREASSKQVPAWTWGALKQEKVLAHLYDVWIQSEKRCRVSFFSNAGFAGDAHVLHQICRGQLQPSDSLLDKLASMLDVSEEVCREFIAALELPSEPLPRRKELWRFAIHKVMSAAEFKGFDARAGQQSFERLVQRIQVASEDKPADDDQTLLWDLLVRKDAIISNEARKKYISSDEARSLLLPRASTDIASPVAHDPSFIGRDAELTHLRNLLKPGDVGAVSPVVVSGPAGIGKSALVAELAAQCNNSFSTLWLDASDAAALAAASQALTQTGSVQPTMQSGGQQLFPAELLADARRLLILDNVQDMQAMRLFLPSASATRILMTSQQRELSSIFPEIDLKIWSRQSSLSYIYSHLPHETEHEQDRLAAKLGDHPLAIVQAVNHCAASDLSLDEYVRRYDRAPRELLSRGVAGRYDKTAWGALSLSIGSLGSSNSAILLGVLCTMESSTIPERVLADFGWLGYVSDEPAVKSRTVGRNRFRLFGNHGRPSGELAGDPVSWEALDFKKRLSDVSVREAALDELVKRNLVRRVGANLLIHPLTIVVRLQRMESKRPYLEHAFGLISPELVSRSISPDMLPIATRLASIAQAEGFYGPGVLGLLNQLSQQFTTMVLPEEALKYAEQALRIGERLAEKSGFDMFDNAPQRYELALRLLNVGRTAEGMKMLEELLDNPRIMANQVARPRVQTNLALVAAHELDTELAGRVLSTINEDDLKSDFKLRRARAHLLRICGKAEEGQGELRALFQLALSGDVSSSDRTHIFMDIRDLAELDVDSGPYVSAMLDCARDLASKGKLLDCLLLYEKGADHLLDRGELVQANKVIDEAWAYAGDLSDDALIKLQLLSVRGRLRYCQERYHEARRDLLTAYEGLITVDQRHATLSAILVHLGQVEAALGIWSTAEARVLEAIELDTERYGPNDPEIVLDQEILLGVQLRRRLFGPRST